MYSICNIYQYIGTISIRGFLYISYTTYRYTHSIYAILVFLRRLPRQHQFISPQYESKCMLLGLQSLEDRRLIASLAFMFTAKTQYMTRYSSEMFTRDSDAFLGFSRQRFQIRTMDQRKQRNT